MKTVRPKALGSALSGLPLTPEEGFVLSRIDGRLSVRDLVALTGIDEPRIEQIVQKLAAHGAVDFEAESSKGMLSAELLPEAAPSDPGTATFADFASVLGLDPSSFAAADPRGAIEAPPAPPTEPIALEPHEPRSNYPPPADPLEDEERDPKSEESTAEATDQAVTDAAQGDADEKSEADDDADERNYRQVYETRFHALSTEMRILVAKTTKGPDLLALCLDPDPKVIAAILENPTTGLEQVRLIALHHRTGTGLEMISRRSELLRDVQVDRRLLKNPQAGDVVLGRVFATKRLFQTYKIAIDRDVPELTRAKGRGFLRQKFQSSPPEERADLVLRTEGRCLAMMTGCTFDAKMTGILCGRAYNSVLFIQNLAKFSATPPNLLAHLMKQPFVRKNVPLKRLLLQHPNMPGDVKRQG